MTRKHFVYGALFWAALMTAGGCKPRGLPLAEGKATVTVLTFAAYDFVREIAADRVNLAMLLPPGAESHSFEPSPRDIIAIQRSALFIFAGGEGDRWADRILASLGEEKGGGPKVLRMIGLVEAVEEELIEGMEEEAGDEGEEISWDEHVWTAPLNAARIVRGIAEELAAIDPENAGLYRLNAEAYAGKLRDLDAAFRELAAGGRRKTVVFADRFPFRYLTDAYGLTYYAAFPGCSTETEPSAATAAFLIDKIRGEGIPVVFHIELSNERMADALAEATGARKLLLHACHNISKKDFEAGRSYLELMEVNLENLREALY